MITAKQAAAMAAELLVEARTHPLEAETYIAIADGWTRLHRSLADHEWPEGLPASIW